MRYQGSIRGLPKTERVMQRYRQSRTGFSKDWRQHVGMSCNILMGYFVVTPRITFLYPVRQKRQPSIRFRVLILMFPRIVSVPLTASGLFMSDGIDKSLTHVLRMFFLKFGGDDLLH